MALLEQFIESVGGIALSCLPRRYREKWISGVGVNDLARGAVLSGLCQASLGLTFFLARFFAIAPRSGLPPLPIDIGRAGGFLTMINAVFEPLNMLFLFLFLEGVLRVLAGLTGETLPLLPLQLVAWFEDAREGRSRMRAMGPPVADRVEELGIDTLRIRSWGRKPLWHPYVSIRYGGGFYGVMREAAGSGGAYVYDLRRRREDEAVVVVYEYDPNDGASPQSTPRRWNPRES